MDLPGPTTSVGTRTDYSVGPWDYPACATRHLSHPIFRRKPNASHMCARITISHI
jgi:tRNA(Ile2) C34 agmatinyltransferase TiaS